MTLNDTEVQKQAEEEFQIEKSRLVQNQRLKIMEYYSRKEKQIELTKKIQDSNVKNQSRLKILQSRENHINALLKEASERLKKLTYDRQVYQNCLTGLITEGLFQLLEPKVIIQCRQVDYDLVQNVLPNCLADLKKTTQIDAKVTIDKNFLPSSLAGGVILQNVDGRIKVVNTLESRLDQISEHLMPQLREIIFGVNEGRKFRN